MKGTFLFFLTFLTLNCVGQKNAIDSLSMSKIKMDSHLSNILIYIENESFNYKFDKNYGEIANSPTQNIQFKIASSTKLFVATIIMQLAEEGKINLDDFIAEHLNTIDYIDFKNLHIINDSSYSNSITIRDLLSHRSGLADIFTDKQNEFFSIVLQNPQKQYSPKKIVELYYNLGVNKLAHFEPNQGWSYSDMNYVLLGLLIEKIDNKTLAQSIRNRILAPLKMNYTYFEFYEEPSKTGTLLNQFIGELNFTEINTSFDWSGGGLVSTNKDLAKFIKALFKLELINQSSLNLMLDTKFTKSNENEYGLGIYKTIYNGKVFYGHYGFYGSYIGYCPIDGTIISYCINQAHPNFNTYQYINEVIQLIEYNRNH